MKPIVGNALLQLGYNYNNKRWVARQTKLEDFSQRFYVSTSSIDVMDYTI
ncbi:hypothetical protein OAT16_01380 [Prolixibacteraceae bacterium]|nr:hypothetical protein [Prolixibacteraceae bacterium]